MDQWTEKMKIPETKDLILPELFILALQSIIFLSEQLSNTLVPQRTMGHDHVAKGPHGKKLDEPHNTKPAPEEKKPKAEPEHHDKHGKKH